MDNIENRQQQPAIIVDDDNGDPDPSNQDSEESNSSLEGESTQNEEQEQRNQRQDQTNEQLGAVAREPSGTGRPYGISAYENSSSTSQNQQQQQHYQQRQNQGSMSLPPQYPPQPFIQPFAYGMPPPYNPYGGGHPVMYGLYPHPWAPPIPPQAHAPVPPANQYTESQQPTHTTAPIPQPGVQGPPPYTQAQMPNTGHMPNPIGNPYPPPQWQAYQPPNAPMNGTFGANGIMNTARGNFGDMAEREPWKETDEGPAPPAKRRKRTAAKSVIKRPIPPAEMRTFHSNLKQPPPKQSVAKNRIPPQQYFTYARLPPQPYSTFTRMPSKPSATSTRVASKPSAARTKVKAALLNPSEKNPNEVYSGPPDDPLEGGWPPGWIKKAILRTAGVAKGKADRYWYTPKLGFKLRSLSVVKRFIAALKVCDGDEDKAFTMIGRKG